MARRWSVILVAAIGAGAVFYGGVQFLAPWPRREGAFLTAGAMDRDLTFPPGFLWGVATAGTQVEGRQASDWGVFEQDAVAHRRFASGAAPGTTEPGNIRHFGDWPENVQREKSGFETRYRDDIAMAAGMGVNAFRFSIEWARLFPRADMTAPSPEGIAYYQALLAEMRAHHITPFVTLFHYVSPAWFWQADARGKRGWERGDALVLWQRYVDAVAANFVPEVQNWCTLNEPMVFIKSGYLDGAYPPLEKRGGVGDVTEVFAALVRAHAAAYHTLHRAADAAHVQVNVGMTEAVPLFAPYRDWWLPDRLTADYVDHAWNWDFLDAIATGRVRITNTDFDRTIEGLAGTEDYVGINYYQKIYVRSSLFDPGNPDVLTVDPAGGGDVHDEIGNTVYPHGLYRSLVTIAGKYHKPIYVLENGTAEAAHDDRLRQRSMVAHVREIWLAMHEGGADVRGYFHWSLMDNFEWVEGFDARFGLVAVDYKDGFKRVPRVSAGVYEEIMRSNSVSAALMKQYLSPNSK